MASDVQLALLVVLAVMGGIYNAVVGWANTDEPFVLRKFLATIGRAAIGAAVAAYALFSVPDVTFPMYVLAFFGGAGVDVAAQRTQAAAQSKSAEPEKPINETK